MTGNLLRFCFAVLLVVFISGCGKKEKSSSTEFFDPNSVLKHYNILDADPVVIELPKELKEVSGITTMPDGLMLTHNDEKGVVFGIDAEGTIVKQFGLGDPFIKDDFEGIAYAEDNIYMVTGNGTLYEFKEGENNSKVEYQAYKTGLDAKNDVEGLYYDKETNSLLLACKGYPGEGYADKKAVYSFSLKDKKLETKPRFLLSITDLKGGEFNPSDISRDPASGNYFVIAANGNAIIEMDKTGKILAYNPLPKKLHQQPEGITFLPDKTMVITNEGAEGKANMVLYKYE
jgi:uncharacterized protein YjiK